MYRMVQKCTMMYTGGMERRRAVKENEREREREREREKE